MSKHTKEPWRIEEEDGLYMNLVGSDGYIILQDVMDNQLIDDLKRISACVNACAGISNETLQSWMTPPEGQLGAPHGTWAQQLAAAGSQLVQLQQQRDKLLAAAKAFFPNPEFPYDFESDHKSNMALREVIFEIEATL